MAAKKEQGEIQILEIETGVLEFSVIGTSPFIANRMSQKALQELLLPRRKSASEKMANLKHNPLNEYRDSIYRMLTPNPATEIAFLPTAFKKSLAQAAIDIPGARKTEIGRLVSVQWDRTPMWGIPQMMMAVTRSADINKTPDVRTRAILPEWACKLTVSFVKPNLREKTVANLVAAAGIICGVGDWRQEKGSGSFGAFRICAPEDPDFVRLVETQNRPAQLAALESPQMYDDETASLYEWYKREASSRGFEVKAVSHVEARTVQSEDMKQRKRANGEARAA